ncbi:MAG: ATP-dependent helicase [Planctomycetes bacterium]|nr:ATP-dependent helicase [Planctomycetota bacterium]
MLDLRTEFDRLNNEQREAVLHNGNTVVLAGPGSGKTATLVVKVAHLIRDVITPPCGVACITYGRDAAGEFKHRLSDLGIKPGHRLFLGTVHGFCLRHIVRPFGALIGDNYVEKAGVVLDATTDRYVQIAIDEVGVNEKVGWFRTTLSRIRKSRACGEDLRGYQANQVKAAVRYEELLREKQELDFEAIVLESLKIIREQPRVRDLINCKFPWLVIDEYQDLGGPLHQIVGLLSGIGSAKVFAVGDPDQTIHTFNGADPKYLGELTGAKTFKTVRLKFNYRSGSMLIAASEAALGDPNPRGYLPDPNRKDPGEIHIRQVGGGSSEQVGDIHSQIIPFITREGIPLHEIAILYPRKGALLTQLQEQLTVNGIPFVAERDEKFPRSPLIKWLQRAANRMLGAAPDEPVPFEELVWEYSSLLENAGVLEAGDFPLQERVRLYVSLEKPFAQGSPLHLWLSHLDEVLGLTKHLASTVVRKEDAEDWKKLTASAGMNQSPTIAEFAYYGRVRGKLAITTLHSSKGRQFDAVIMPCVQDGLLPQRSRNRFRSTWDNPTPARLADDRRLFYVGLTRARRYIFVIYSEQYRDEKGLMLPSGPSRFITEIKQKLGRS